MEHKLAIDGGTAVRKTPLPPWPWYSEDDIEIGAAVLRSGKLNYWTGSEGRQFEREFSFYVGRPYAVALANGTVALESALEALDIGEGDEVIVPSRTFIATASSVVMRGATPIVADVDPDSQTITADTVRQVLTPRTKAIIVVHLAGWPCDMDPILSVAQENGLKVIEDCAQCHGARYKGRMAGALADIAAFSFCQDKILTTCGEGGMLVTDSAWIFERAWRFKDHGKNYKSANTKHPGCTFRWLHDSFGTNWRLTEVQSALGRAMLRKLDEQVAIRRRNAGILIEHLKELPALRVPVPGDDVEHSYYKFYAFIRPELLHEEWTRDRIVAAINAEGIPCFSGICSEIYLEGAFARFGPPNRLEVARSLGETSLMFLVHPTLQVSDMLDMCTAVEKVLAAATRTERALVQAA
jgi:dTDP-4-amino-4,6-dideoxygalactose transaminase